MNNTGKPTTLSERRIAATTVSKIILIVVSMISLQLHAALAGAESSNVPPSVQEVVKPIPFVAQVTPMGGDVFGSIASTFANHIPSMNRVVHGGDLMIRYADGSLVNLTREVGFGESVDRQ